METALSEARTRAAEARELRGRVEERRRSLEQMERKISSLALFDERQPLLEARAEAARIERETRARFDAALLAVQRGLEAGPGKAQLLKFLEHLLWGRYLEAEALEESVEMKRLEVLILSYVPHLRERLTARGSVSIQSDPADADVYLFRYESAGPLLRPLPYHPQFGRLLEPEGLPPFALEVVHQPQRILVERGLCLGDRILSVSGFPVGPTGNRVLTKINHLVDPGCQLVVERESTVLRLAPGVWLQNDDDQCARTEYADELLNDCTELDPFPLVILDEGRIGSTPRQVAGLEAGSYLCLLRHAGRRDTRVPFTVRRGEAVELKVRMFREEQVPEGFVHVPAGPARLGGDPDGFYPEPARQVEMDDYFISRQEVGFMQYFEFLNDPVIRAEIEAYTGSGGSALLPKELKEGKVIPAYRWGEDGRLEPTNHDWSVWKARFVSKVAAERYAQWLNDKERSAGARWVFALPSSDEIEKAARGADGRRFPWGNSFEWSLTCSRASNATQNHRQKPFSTDCSPYGVRDLCGSVAELTRSLEVPPGAPLDQLSRDDYDCQVKGGSGFDDLEPFFHLGGHTQERARDSSYRIGFRLVAYPAGEPAAPAEGGGRVGVQPPEAK
jgi:formylglycine-generating enzyme required for sulfatase activity